MRRIPMDRSIRQERTRSFGWGLTSQVRVTWRMMLMASRLDRGLLKTLRLLEIGFWRNGVAISRFSSSRLNDNYAAMKSWFAMNLDNVRSHS
uniref:Uncharacterized protein n=1 Tax=Brassica campestris TaxID=3711 RepID=A0A3P5YL70_BRACM|nr:unnamed protein product [Brassica rapa]